MTPRNNTRAAIVGADIGEIGERLDEDAVKFVLLHVGAPAVLCAAMKTCGVIATFAEFTEVCLRIPSVDNRLSLLKSDVSSHYFLNERHEFGMRGICQ